MTGWMECSHHYSSIQICSFFNLPKIWENLGESGFPKKREYVVKYFLFIFYFLHLCEISGTKYGGLETGGFLFNLSQFWQKFSKQ
jgi:hypothetical protein